LPEYEDHNKTLTTLRGIITRSQSGFYTVVTESGEYICRLRGRLKRGPRVGDVAAIGDWVKLTPTSAAHGMIEEVEARQRMLARLAPTPSGQYQQVIIANPDQALFVFACQQPAPRLRMLDRFLVIAEKQEIPAMLVANKVDLVGIRAARDLFGHYEEIGYPVIYTSAKDGFGLAELYQCLVGKVSVFAGPSGAGKSSLLNQMLPDLDLAARAVSQATNKGRHTTVAREMYPLPEGGYIAGYFPELRSRVADCQFSNCTHIHEPGCAIQAAVEQGLIHPERYESYIRMRLGQEDDEQSWV